MKVIILGARGYLGSNIQKYCVDNGVLAITPDFSERLDYRNREAFTNSDWDVDAVFFCVGRATGLEAFERYDDIILDNQITLLNTLHSIKESGFKPKVVFPSTRTVYRGSVSSLPEDSALQSKSLYSATKIACEQILEAYSIMHDIPYTVLRLCVPYGSLVDTPYSYGTLKLFLEQWALKEKITLFGDGENKRTFTHISLVCECFIRSAAASNLDTNVLNIPGETHSLLDLALFIAKDRNKINFEEWPELYLRAETGDTVFDGSNAMRLLGVTVDNYLAEWIDMQLGGYSGD